MAGGFFNPTLCKFESTTTGPGAMVEGSAVAGFRTYASAGGQSGYRATMRWQNAGATEYEEGVYTYTVGTPGQFARTEIHRSSNGGAAVSWSAGTKTGSVIHLHMSHGVRSGELKAAEATIVGSALTVTFVPAPMALVDYLHGFVKLPSDLPVAATLNPNGLGAEPLKELVAAGLAAPAAARYKAGTVLEVLRVGSQWQILNAIGESVVAASDTVAGLAERATPDETQVGTDAARFVSPAGLAVTRGDGTAIASASSIALPANGRRFSVTGTTTIATITEATVALPAGVEVALVFAAALSLTHGANLVCPGAAALAVAAGDEVKLVKFGAGQWKVVEHFKATPATTGAVAILSHTVAANTAGGTATSGSWGTAPLNVEDSDPSGIVSLASNEFTLAAGTYHLQGFCGFGGNADRCQARIWNVSDSAVALIGSSGGSASSGVNTQSLFNGLIALAGSKTFRMEYRVTSTVPTNGLGVPCNFGVNEVHRQLSITKVG